MFRIQPLTSISKARISQPSGCSVVGLHLDYYVASTGYSPEEPDEKRMAFTGYRDLFDCLAPVHKSRSCEHGDSKAPVTLQLENDAIIVND